MLKKAITANIMPTTRKCKCGVTGSIDPTTVITRCGHCNEILFEETKTAAVKAPVKSQEDLVDEDLQHSSGDTGAEKPSSKEVGADKDSGKKKSSSKSGFSSLF